MPQYELVFHPQPLAYTLQGAADACGLSLSFLKLWVEGGELTRRYVGTKPLILASELLAFLESLPYEPTYPSRPANR